MLIICSINYLSSHESEQNIWFRWMQNYENKARMTVMARMILIVWFDEKAREINFTCNPSKNYHLFLRTIFFMSSLILTYNTHIHYVDNLKYLIIMYLFTNSSFPNIFYPHFLFNQIAIKPEFPAKPILINLQLNINFELIKNSITYIKTPP